MFSKILTVLFTAVALVCVVVLSLVTAPLVIGYLSELRNNQNQVDISKDLVEEIQPTEQVLELEPLIDDSVEVVLNCSLSEQIDNGFSPIIPESQEPPLLTDEIDTPIPSSDIAEKIVGVQEDIDKLLVPALRERCKERGIEWANAHGKGKHLKKAEMIALLKGAATT